MAVVILPLAATQLTHAAAMEVRELYLPAFQTGAFLDTTQAAAAGVEIPYLAARQERAAVVLAGLGILEGQMALREVLVRAL